MQPVVLGGGEELPGFVGGEGFEASGAWGAGADVAGDVARDLFLSDGVLQGGLEDGVDVGERHGGHIWAVRGLPYECPGVRGGASVVGRLPAAMPGSARREPYRAPVSSSAGTEGSKLIPQVGDEVVVSCEPACAEAVRVVARYITVK
ncbi:hypothetical protein GCM10010469_38960 [Streptomyces labedae]|uniref:Uncharacterized protein n=1 Tax=Streptomyces labedae TaxID=285569 RepID=A0ABP6R6E7_9ACTN